MTKEGGKVFNFSSVSVLFVYPQDYSKKLQNFIHSCSWPKKRDHWGQNLTTNAPILHHYSPPTVHFQEHSNNLLLADICTKNEALQCQWFL